MQISTITVSACVFVRWEKMQKTTIKQRKEKEVEQEYLLLSGESDMESSMRAWGKDRDRQRGVNERRREGGGNEERWAEWQIKGNFTPIRWLLTLFCRVGGAVGLSLPLSADGALLLLQSLFLCVGLLPAALLHQTLIRPPPAICGSNTLLRLVQCQRQGREVVHVFSAFPTKHRERKGRKLWRHWEIPVKFSLEHHNTMCQRTFTKYWATLQLLTNNN